MRSETINPVCEGDCCQSAVVRAYREMQKKGEPNQFALDAALAVFSWYHPDVHPARAQEIVACWVHEGAVH